MEEEKSGFWRSLGWPEWLLAGAIVIIVITVAAILSPDLRAFIANSVTAAWVQALGTILAMGAAIWVSRTQSKTQRKAAQQEADRQRKLRADAWEIELEAAAQVIEKLGADIDLVADAAMKSPKLNEITPYRRARFLKSSLEAASKVEVHKMPFAVIARQTIEIRHQANVCVELLEAMSPNGNMPADALASPRTPEDRFSVAARKTREALSGIDHAVKAFDGQSPPISHRHL